MPKLNCWGGHLSVVGFARIEIRVVLTLHKETKRPESYRSFAPFEWSESLRSWCVLHPGSMVAVLELPELDVVDDAAAPARANHCVFTIYERIDGSINE